ncbi:MAG: ABC transporter substrate-binding protein [Candidatus Sungbacteria bacterium]|nr:ABC transporter substrate-binding protein [Candidatus Sungbacteria bacterium]
MEQLWKYAVWLLAGILIVLTIVEASGENPYTPTARVRNAVSRTREILENQALDREEKKQVIKDIIVANFDVPGISQAVLGTHWPKYKSRAGEFSVVFIAHLADLFVEKVPAEIIKGAFITYRSERVDSGGTRATVYTHLIFNDYKLYVTFTLIFKDGEWRIYNIAVEWFGSFIGYFRTRVDNDLRVSSFDELLDSLGRR